MNYFSYSLARSVDPIAMPRKQIASLMVFSRAIIKDQRRIGAVAPSSWALSRRMASYIPKDYDGHVVELGPGTGSITDALLKRGIAPERLHAIEFTPDLVRHMKNRFPKINVIEGDAANLATLLPKEVMEQGIDYIVSGLPLRAMGQEIVDGIIGAVRENLTEDGLYIQFTYSHARDRNRIIKDMRLCESSLVWLNFPPARVDVLEANGQHVKNEDCDTNGRV